MPSSEAELLAILKIGHDTSARGEGISLSDALARTHYCTLRASIGADDLLPLLKANPAMIEEWLAYSQDKRTSGGFYLTNQAEIGAHATNGEKEPFTSLEHAVAEFVLRELDFWATIAPD